MDGENNGKPYLLMDDLGGKAGGETSFPNCTGGELNPVPFFLNKAGDGLKGIAICFGDQFCP